MPIPSRYSDKTVVQSIPARLWEKENAHRNYFAARGGDLVTLVYLVCLVRRMRETRQTRAPDKPPGDVARCLSGQFNIHHSTLNILFTYPLPSHKTPHRALTFRPVHSARQHIAGPAACLTWAFSLPD